MSTRRSRRIVQSTRYMALSGARWTPGDARTKISSLLTEANTRAIQILGGEVNRLKTLAKVNANVRPEEIDFFENQLQLVTQALGSASLRLDALRVMLVT